LRLRRRAVKREESGIRRGGKEIDGGWDVVVEVAGLRRRMFFGGYWVGGRWSWREGEGGFEE